MAETKIEWCDYTLNPWRGCRKVSDGCKHCYAENRAGQFGEDFAKKRIRLSDAGWRRPLKWDHDACLHHAGRLGPTDRPRVFCASLADVFEDWDGPIVDCHGSRLNRCWACGHIAGYVHRVIGCSVQPDVPASDLVTPLTMDDLRHDLFTLIDETPHLDWILLTKRPENVRRMWPVSYVDTGDDCEDEEEREFFAEGAVRERRSNVWLGTSVENQEPADRRIPELLKCRDLAPVLFVSCEPLLGPINLGQYVGTECTHDDARLEHDTGALICKRCDDMDQVDWVIAGGESGRNARPCNVAWIRSIRDQCREAGTPIFIKQLGTHVTDQGTTMACSYPDSMCWPAGTRTDVHRVLLSDSKGGDPSEWPEDLRVREFPRGGSMGETESSRPAD